MSRLLSPSVAGLVALATALSLGAMTTTAVAQTFDVASIQRDRDAAFDFEDGLIGLAPGRLTARHSTLRELIAQAYGVRSPGVPMPPLPPPPSGPVMTPLHGRGLARCPTMFFTGMISARSASIDTVVDRLTHLMSRPIADATGLTGEFDLDLDYQTGVSAEGDTGLDGAAPALLAALQEQLGLRLDAGRAPVDVLVIDRARPATEN